MTLRTDLASLPMSSTPSNPPPARKRTAARNQQAIRLALIGVGILGLGVLAFSLKGSGALSWLKSMVGMGHRRAVEMPVPVVVEKEMSPRDCWTGVDPAAPIILPLQLPNGPLDLKTLNDDSVSIFRFDNHQRVPAKVAFVNNAIRVTPLAPLEPNRNYRVHLLPGVKDVKGQTVKQRSLAFYTSAQPPTGVAYEKVELPEAQGASGYSPSKGDPSGFRSQHNADDDADSVAPAFSEGFTCVEFGPDGKLYAATDHGKIARFTVNADGTLANRETFTTLPDHEYLILDETGVAVTDADLLGRVRRFVDDLANVAISGNEVSYRGQPLTDPKDVRAARLAKTNNPFRLVTGFCFDPASTPDNMVIYMTSSEFGFGFPKPVTDFSGHVVRLSGPHFENYELLVKNLPRSARDHATNQPHFGPDGALYIPQPSNTATGGADETWAMRQEHGLNATILRLDVHKLTPGQTLDAMTRDVSTYVDKNRNGKQDANEPTITGTYDQTAPNAPLTIFAEGLRMPYDLLWHSNGHFYTAVNGASSGGATPAGPNVAAINNVGITEHDWLFRIDRPGQYCGHPNPTQGHFVLNGGNPTAAPDFNEVSDYPVGTQPDSQWVPAIYDFGCHVSANGTIELKSNAFNGALKGKVVICRFSYYQDLIFMGFDEHGDVNYAATGIPGTTGLDQPLDIVEDQRNGNLYVCEYGVLGGKPPRITLLRPIQR